MSQGALLDLQVRISEGLKTIPAEAWDSCAFARTLEGSAPGGLEEPCNPFVSHAFLSSLEDAGCVSGRSGWLPTHVLVERSDGTLVAAAP